MRIEVKGEDGKTMIPKLIVSDNQIEIQKHIDSIIHQFGVSKFDATLLNQENSSIKIEQIRELKQKLNLKPFQSKYKASIIYNAENLTVEAQNAMLKVLEEPPENTVILLCSSNENLLLPTIVSRCEIVRLKFQNFTVIPAKAGILNSKIPDRASLVRNDKKENISVNQITRLDLGEKLALAENLTKKIDKEEKLEDTRKRTEAYVKEFTKNYMKSDETINKNNLVILQQTLKNIKSNLNIKLTLENCFMNLC